MALPPLGDVGAQQLVSRILPSLTLAESQFLRVIARHESFYARGWKPNDHIEGAVGDPITSHNMGAITAPKAWVDAGKPFFTYLDGLTVKESRKFKIYPDDDTGMRDLANELFQRRPGIREALRTGDGFRAVQVMKESRYFEATLESYIEAATRNYDSLLKNTKESRVLRFAQVISTPKGPQSEFIDTGTSAGIEIAVAIGAVYMLSRWR